MRRAEVSHTRAPRYRNALVALVALGGLWWRMRPSSGDTVAGVARALSAALSEPGQRATSAVITNVSERVVVNVAGVRRELTRTELAAWVNEYLSVEGPKWISLSGLEVRVSGERAHLEALLVASETQHGDLHAEERPVFAEFELQERWRLQSLDLGVPVKYIPEARP